MNIPSIASRKKLSLKRLKKQKILVNQPSISREMHELASVACKDYRKSKT